MKEPVRTIGLVFIPGFADWEYGMLSASAVEWFGGRAVALSPDGRGVRSMSGFTLTPDRPTEAAANGDLDAVAVVGSDDWASAAAPDVSGLLRSVRERNGIVGGICAGTLALARAGLFAQASHTSNGRDWILQCLPDYDGRANYKDVPHAVADGGVVSAPGSAPGTFALAFLAALYPDRASELGEMRAMFSREYSGRAS